MAVTSIASTDVAVLPTEITNGGGGNPAVEVTVNVVWALVVMFEEVVVIAWPTLLLDILMFLQVSYPTPEAKLIGANK
jgi:hypothetical protein